ncbi:MULTISPECIES: aminodeoxychorismate/anthranilate synthase component II [unclassified Frankia]|uniref:aminodeoxychorismate/anthranilate synthase component II n=1 Tax=unclassified Frankia TaxID=2632575 RepID=UPI002024C12C
MRILVVDNYDSFVFNLVQYLGQLGADSVVRRNDEVDVDELTTLGVAGVLVSPGPGTPEAAGVSVPMIRACAAAGIPMLGVCLGHQALGVAFGATVGRAPELLHGKTSVVRHQGAGVLADLPSPFIGTRYHSLAVDWATLPAEIEVTAWTDSGVVMAMRHRALPLEGVQFHPESVLTQGGHLLLARWLSVCGDDTALSVAPTLSAEVETLRQAAFA